MFYFTYSFMTFMGCCGRGSRKKKKGWFKKGETSWRGKQNIEISKPKNVEIKKLKRLTHQEFQKSFKLDKSRGVWIPRAAELLETKNADTSVGAVLRPRLHDTSQVERMLQDKNDSEPVSTYVEVHLTTCIDTIQESVNEHKLMSPTCEGRLMTPTNMFTKWGVSAIIRLKCNSCKYTSDKKRLYRELQITTNGKGRKAAEPNRSLAVGLFNTSIAAAGAQRLLSSMNKPVPCASGLQRQLNDVGRTLRSLNEEDMCEQRSQVKQVLENGGFPRNTPIPAEADRQYNIPLRNSRRKTPFAPATQTRDVIVENVTPQKKIIAFNHENKLCKVRECAELSGVKVNCPGHVGCTATLSAEDNAGDEKNGGRKLASMLTSSSEPILVDKLCTDADGRMAEGFAEVMNEKHGVKTEHFLDTTHLNRAVAKAISGARITPEIVTLQPCKSKDRHQAINRLADSMAWRAEREVRAANKIFGHDKDLAAKSVVATIPAIIRCYEGNHVLCKKHSLVCDGEQYTYEYIPKFARGAYRFSSSDTKVLVSILRKRMGEEAMYKTRFSLTTQKAESTNHAFVTTNPKHSMSCSRNGVNRDHSAIHMINNPVGDSILIKAKACGVPMSPNSPCLSTLHQLNRRQNYFRKRASSPTYNMRRAARRRKRYEIYDNRRNESFYVKSQLDPK